MTLEQLRIFVAVAEREHMTAAARAVHVTQSAASAAIAALEQRHDIKLFHRIGRGIVLTGVGRSFLAEARAVLARARAAEQTLEEFGDLRRGELRLIASQTIAAYWLPPILAGFRERYPQLSVELMLGNTAYAAAKVIEGAADLGIVEGEVDDPLLTHWQIGEDRLQLVSAEAARVRKIDAAWLQQARWVMREPGSGTRSTFNETARRMGVDPERLDVALVLPSNESVRTAVEAGVGVAALSSLVVAPALAAGTLHALPIDLGRRAFFGVSHRERYRSKAVEALLALLRQIPRD